MVTWTIFIKSRIYCSYLNINSLVKIKTIKIEEENEVQVEAEVALPEIHPLPELGLLEVVRKVMNPMKIICHLD